MHRLPPILLLLALIQLAPACSEEKHQYVANAGDSTPTMQTSDVITFVSDSGYTRYKITTRLWQMFEDAKDPYWRFPDGLHLQQFDKDMKPEATLVCDSARFFSNRGLWQLDGHVVAVNTMADSFLTNQLFWNRSSRKVYTDSFVHIVRTDHILEGYGLESDEQMNAYKLNHPTGIIPIADRDNGALPTAAADSTDSVATASNQGRSRRPQRQQMQTEQ